MCTTGDELMCPSSWKLYLDDFPFLGSSLAHLEPKLELFEFWEFGSWWLFVARLSPIYVLFAFKIFLLPVPTRPGTRPFLQVPDPSRPEVKNPFPSDPALKVELVRSGPYTCTRDTYPYSDLLPADRLNCWHWESVPDLAVMLLSIKFWPRS